MSEINVNDANFQSCVKDVAGTPVLVDFWAPWCGPCRMLAPHVEALAEEMDGRLVVCKCNVDESQQTAAEHGIMSIPTLVVYKDGEIVAQRVGGMGKAQLAAFVEQYL